MIPRLVPLYLAFAVMGLADAMGPLAAQVRTRFEVGHATATLLTFFVFLAFGVFSVPAGLLSARVGKRRVLLTGLGMNGLALGLVAFVDPSFAGLVSCIFLLGIGTTLLQVAGNPMVRDLGDGTHYARDLAFAQFVKGLGAAAAAFLLGASAADWHRPFLGFFVVVAIAFVGVWVLREPERPTTVTAPGFRDCLALLGDRSVAAAVLGIFLYVGAEVCVARYANTHLAAVGFSEADAGRLGAPVFFAALMAGRLVGGPILQVVSARRLLGGSIALGLLGLMALVSGSPSLAILGVVACGLGFANVWPTVFALTIDRRPSAGAELSGLMCMAVSGGALLPLPMGSLLDAGVGAVAFLIPTAALSYLVVLAVPRASDAPDGGAPA